jgi:hypothetical protein
MRKHFPQMLPWLCVTCTPRSAFVAGHPRGPQDHHQRGGSPARRPAQAIHVLRGDARCDAGSKQHAGGSRRRSRAGLHRRHRGMWTRSNGSGVFRHNPDTGAAVGVDFCGCTSAPRTDQMGAQITPAPEVCRRGG